MTPGPPSCTKLTYPTVTIDFPLTLRGMDADDPLARALAPPPDETLEERDERQQKEAEAQRVSDEIDEALRQERALLKKKKVMKMLLLGQAESGKSTTLKAMQLTYAPRAWAAERASWRAVTQLNLIRSINAILDALASELSAPPGLEADARSSSEEAPPTSPWSSTNVVAAASAQISIPVERRPAFSKLKLRLAPLRQVEIDLKTRLGAGADEVAEAPLPHLLSAWPDDAASSAAQGDEGTMMATPFDQAAYRTPNSRPQPTRIAVREIVVRSHKAWKDRERDSAWRKLTGARSPGLKERDRDRDSATDVLAGCREDMLMLWADPVVRAVVKRRKVLAGLGDSAEYFLGRIEQIATRDYEPSDADVLRARIRTLGVQELGVVFEQGNPRDLWKEWAIFDVGGSRTNRAAWLPYFSDVQAVLFLAPISAFNERLTEDKRVNRLEDTFVLWKSIVTTPMLAKANIILFMNKYDLLEKKLAAGIRINKYMTSYGTRGNDAETFSEYLKHKFSEIHAGGSPEKRPFYGHQTSVIDADATAKTLASVRDSIVQGLLKSAALVA